MYTKVLIPIVFVFCSFYVSAQNDQTSEVENEIIQIKRDSTKLIPTYTVLLYSGTNPEAADSCIALYKSNFNDLNVTNFISCPPNYKATAGEFTQRIDGYRHQKKVARLFPNSLLIPQPDCP